MKDDVFLASENLKKFFSGLLLLKEFVKEEFVKDSDPVLKQILDKLDLLIQEEK